MALQESLTMLRVKVAIQQSRTVRLYNPMLEARIKRLRQRVATATERMGVMEGAVENKPAASVNYACPS